MEARWWTGWMGFRKSPRTAERHRARSPAVDGSAPAAVAAAEIPVPRGYSPLNVGNDASARPWESVTPVPEVASPGPHGFDAESFLQASKDHFVNLQDAWDRSDIPSLRAMMTEGMLAEIQSQLADRERSGGGSNRTEVVMLEAQLLGLEERDEAFLASVEFSGLIREDVSAGPNPFREVWSIARPKKGDGDWLVAGVQALQ